MQDHLVSGCYVINELDEIKPLFITKVQWPVGFWWYVKYTFFLCETCNRQNSWFEIVICKSLSWSWIYLEICETKSWNWPFYGMKVRNAPYISRENVNQALLLSPSARVAAFHLTAGVCTWTHAKGPIRTDKTCVLAPPIHSLFPQ